MPPVWCTDCHSRFCRKMQINLLKNNNFMEILRKNKFFCSTITCKYFHLFTIFIVKHTTKASLQIRYARPPSCCYVGTQHFCNDFGHYEFLSQRSRVLLVCHQILYKICSLQCFSCMLRYRRN